MALGNLVIGVRLDTSQLTRDLGAMKVALDNVGKNSTTKALSQGFSDAEKAIKDTDSASSKAERTVSKLDSTARKASTGTGILGKALMSVVNTAGLPTLALAGVALQGLGATAQKIGGPLDKVGTGISNAGEAASGAAADIASMGPAGIVASAGLAGATVGVLALGTAIAGVIASVGLFTGVLGGFAAVGAGIVALATKETGPQSAANQAMKALQTSLSNMGKGLGQQASPVAAQMLTWVNQLIPKVNQLGSAFLKAFGNDLPKVMPLATFAVNQLFKALYAMGPVLQQVVQWVEAHRVGLEKLFATVMAQVVPALGGLMKNFESIASWTMVHWPQISTVIGTTFAVIGTVVQICIGILKFLVQTMVWAQQGITASVKFLSGVFSAFGNLFGQIGQRMGQNFSAMGNSAHTFTQNAGNAFSNLGSTVNRIAGGIGKAVGGMFSGALSGAKNDLDNLVRALNSFIVDVDGSPLGKLGLHINKVPLPFATGGIVPGAGSGDTVPAMLTPGEVVLNKSAVAGLGGAVKANKLNTGMGAGLNLGNLGGLIGSIGGQCLAWVSKVTGLFRGVPAAIDLLGKVNSHTPSPGEIFVMGSQVGPYGHTGFVTGSSGGQVSVLDSNWNLDGIIRAHSVPASLISGYIDEGASIAGAVGNALAALNPGNVISGLIGKASFGGAGLFGAMGPAILNAIKGGMTKAVNPLSTVAGTVGSWDNGGGLQPGWNHVFNGTGQVENVQSPAARDEQNKRLAAIEGHMQTLTKKLMGNVTIVQNRGQSAESIMDAISFGTWATSI